MQSSMNSILMSIKPKYCNLIANGKKTIEVRKTKPKLETPFKCYIYCTKPTHFYKVSDCMSTSDEYLHLCEGRVTMGDGFELFDKEYQVLNGKVIGEFICYSISIYETEFYPESNHPIFEAIYKYNEEDEINECVASNDDDRASLFLKNTCLDLESFRKYLGNGENRFYGWHISNLKIYEKPKELNTFQFARPPQSWCYINKSTD